MISKAKILRPAGMAVVVLALVAIGSSARAYTPEQEQMCTGDAMRLCSSAVPDVDRVTACMISKRDQLSPGCKVFFRESEPQAEPMLVTDRSRKATASKSRKPAKPIKCKKPHAN